MKRLVILLLATVFVVNIFFGSWADFRDWVQAFAEDLKGFVVDVTTNPDWWKLKSTPSPTTDRPVETIHIPGKVIREIHQTYLILDENGWHQTDWIEYRDEDGKLLWTEPENEQPVADNKGK